MALEGLVDENLINDFVDASEWMQNANCKDEDPNMFLSSKPEVIATVKKICARCVVKEECLTYALKNAIEDGVWGGLSEKERRALRQRRY